MSFGFVIQANDSQLNKTQLENYLRTVKPRSCTVLNNDDYAAYLKTNVSAETEFYLRHYDADGDETDWKQYTPEAYFDLYAPTTRGGLLGLQIWNEPGFGRDVVERASAFIREALRRHVRISLFGASVGTPPAFADEWAAQPAYREFAELVAANARTVCYDVHEYYAAVWTSGMVSPLAAPGDALNFVKLLLKAEQWPKKLSDVTAMYHCGRVKGFIDYCRGRGWQPTVDISEAGPDNVSEGGGALDQWLKSLPADRRQHVKGFKTLETWWRSVYPQWTPAQTNAEMLKQLWEVVWQPLGVRGVRLFTYGNSGRGGPQDWFDHDYMENTDYLDAVRSLSVRAPGVSTPPSAPTDVPAPGWYILRSVGAFVNLRRTPDIKSDNIITTVPNGSRITILPAEVREGSGWRWLYVQAGDKTGYLALLSSLRFEKQPNDGSTPTTPPLPDAQKMWIAAIEEAASQASLRMTLARGALEDAEAALMKLREILARIPEDKNP